MHIIYFLLATLMITNYSFAKTPEEYFVREKSKGFIGKVGKSGIYDRYRDTMVLHEGSDGEVTIYGVAYMPSYTRRPYIISIKFDRDKNIYTVGHTSRAFESISDFKLFEIDGTKKLFLVAKQDFEHKLVELDLETLNIISNKKIPNATRESIPGFEYGDADNDGIKEFVFGSSDGLLGLDPESLEEKFVISFDSDIFKVDGTLYRPGTNSFKIDNVDSDSNNEIIVNGFPSVIEVNPSLEMKLEMRLWSLDYNYNPPMFFNTHDLDNDGRKEVVVATQNPEYTTSGWLSHIRIFDVEKKEMVQLIDTELPIQEHVFFDLDKDGVDEIVTTSDRYDVIAYNYETGQVHTQFTLDGYGCAGLLFGDFNYDNSDEFFVSCGLNGTMPGHNYIVNLAGEIEWHSNDLSGPIFLGNPEYPKTNELHVLTSRQNAWYDNGRLFKLEADTLATMWDSNEYIYNEQQTQDGYKDLAVFDYDNDGVNEAYFGVQSIGTIYLNQVDTDTNELMEKITIELKDFGLNDEHLERQNASGLNVSKLKSFDFDQDGKRELIIGTQGRSTAAYRLKVIVFDLEENQIIAEYTIDNVGSIENVLFEDLDADGKNEVIILQGYITVLNPEKNTIVYSQENYYSSITKDLDNDLYYAGTFEGSVIELSDSLMSEQKQHRVCGPGEVYYEDSVIDLRVMPNDSMLVLCREHLTMYDVANDEVIGDYYIGRGLLGTWRDMYIYEESDFINIIFDTYHSIEHFRDNDNDNDKIGNIIDDDDDNDGIGDRLDNCPLVSNPNQIDTDGDGAGDICDDDDDNDGVEDGLDNCPLVSNPNQIDTDGDGDGDICDTDDDNDGINDQEDAFPLDPSENADFDGDGIGDNADPDDDNDGMPDEWEEQYGLNPYDSSDRSTDLDNDGISNYQEYVNGTNPTVANNNSGGGNDNPPSSDSGGGGSIPILLLIILSSYFGFRLRSKT